MGDKQVKRHPLSAYAQGQMPRNPGCGWWLVFFWTFPIGIIIWAIDNYQKKSKIYQQNEYDYEAATALNKALSDLAVYRPKIMGTTNNIRVFRKFSVGEVTRHFDSQTNSQITGWLDHNLKVVGWGVGFSVGSTGAGIGQKGIIGKSGVHLNLSGTSRDNLIGDGFIAVLEENPISGNPEIIRLVVPPDSAALEDIASLMTALGKSFGEESYRDLVLRRKITEIQKAVHTNTSHISDRLNSILRTNSEQRPCVTVVGVELNEHAILGGAIQFENDQKWYQLYPVAILSKIIDIVSANANNVLYNA